MFVSLILIWAVGNGAIIGISHVMAARQPPPAAPAELRGIGNLEPVDAHLWRSAAPSAEGYRSLAEAGVRTVIDLRNLADAGLRRNAGAQDILPELGVRLVRIPVSDGHAPSADQVEQFLSIVRASPGIVLVHCGAGVGRTGSMVAAYEVSLGRLDADAALRQSLAVGPPTLEQIVFMAKLERGDIDGPGLLTIVASRALDAPRALWNHIK